MKGIKTPIIKLTNNELKEDKAYKDKIWVEKGVQLTEKKILEHLEIYEKWSEFFIIYPDIFIDLITPKDQNFELYFYQRIFLRALMRYRYNYVTAPRAFSKSFISILALFLQCIFRPKSKVFICAPKIQQGAKIAKEKIYEIYQLFPLLRKEIVGGDVTDKPGSFQKDLVNLTFKNGSVFDVVSVYDSQRGGRRSSGLIDEVRDHNGDDLNQVVLPLLNVSRHMVNGDVNEFEPHQCQYFMTSASDQGTYAYQKLIELFQQQIINPESAFVWGCSYKVPMMHHLLEPSYINEIKMSPTFSEADWAREYMGSWISGSNDSWFDLDKILKHRRIQNPETHEKIVKGVNSFYILAMDVARIGCQSVVSVIKVFINSSGWHMKLVNIYVLGKTPETKTFYYQAYELKKLIQQFHPREVVIDGNGLGVGLLDPMIQETLGPDGITYPAYACINDETYKKIQNKSAEKIIYVIKANPGLNSKIHSNCYAMIQSGRVDFLIKEQEARVKLMSTKVGQKMSLEERARRLMPHEMTSSLVNEMMNLRLKASGSSQDIVLEMINSSQLKDKFSSLEYGLWRIRELEEEASKKNRSKPGQRRLTFYTEGGY